MGEPVVFSETLPPRIAFVAPDRLPHPFSAVLSGQRRTVESLRRSGGGACTDLVDAERIRLGEQVWSLSDPLRAADDPAVRGSPLAVAVAAHAAHAAREVIAFVIAAREADPALFEAWRLLGLATDALDLLVQASELGFDEVAEYEVPPHVLLPLVIHVRNEHGHEAAEEAVLRDMEAEYYLMTEADAS